MTPRRDSSTLEVQLERYSDTVTSSEATRSWKDRIGAWSAYAAVGGSALAMATSANASVIYSGIQNIGISVPEAGGFGSNLAPINIHSQAIFAIALNNMIFPTDRYALARFGTYNGNGLVGTNSYGSLVKFRGSQFVPYGAPTGSSYGVLRYRYANYTGGSNSAYGQFAVGQPGFAGFTFSLSDGPHAGWIRLRLDDINSDGWFETLTALDWAYEDVAFTPIHVPNSAVPEPSTASLALLALGSAGVLAWRKRRKAVLNKA